jgi:hypothetical protein
MTSWESRNVGGLSSRRQINTCHALPLLLSFPRVDDGDEVEGSVEKKVIDHIRPMAELLSNGDHITCHTLPDAMNSTLTFPTARIRLCQNVMSNVATNAPSPDCSTRISSAGRVPNKSVSDAVKYRCHHSFHDTGETKLNTLACRLRSWRPSVPWNGGRRIRNAWNNAWFELMRHARRISEMVWASNGRPYFNKATSSSSR